MPGEKRFRTSLFGFKKSDVNSYVEKILREFDNMLKEKENEINKIKSQNEDIKERYNELLSKSEQINADRAKVADALIQAQEKAERILEDARNQALQEKKSIEELIEKEKEKLIDIKEELRVLKSEAANVLKKYEMQLGNLINKGIEE
ncbi:MAG TPA: hypothetical protein GXX36_07775 [Clostridiaceae bacterium]|nr:hypothetical protein [Clostridiaceae bacterium]